MAYDLFPRRQRFAPLENTFVQHAPPLRDAKVVFYSELPRNLDPYSLAFLMLDEKAHECARTLTVGDEIYTLWGSFKPMTLAAHAIALGEDPAPGVTVERIDGADLWLKLRAYMSESGFRGTSYSLSFPLSEPWKVTFEGGFIDIEKHPTGHELMEAIDEQKARGPRIF